MSGTHGEPVVGCYTACEECWSKAYDIAKRTGQAQPDVYRELVRQPRSHAHGLTSSRFSGGKLGHG